LALNDKAYGHNWNIPGSGVITGEEIIELVREYTGYTKKVSTVTKSMVRLMGLFDRGMREYVEMYYLNEEPVVLSGERYEREVGPLPRTDYKEGIKQTLKHMGVSAI
jgi:nucleoside-diphosphate-sugar epimerase